MGNTSDKENEMIIDSINKSHILQMNDINKTSYTLMNKIISEYDQLKLVIINDSYSAKHKQRLERIKKWISMARTTSCRGSNVHKSCQNRMSRSELPKKEHTRSMSVYNRKPINIVVNNNINSIIVTDEDNDSNNTSICTVSSNVINMNNYTDDIIEKGIKNFYIRNTKKFLERLSKGPPMSFRLLSWFVVNNLTDERNEDIYIYYKNKIIDEEVKGSICRDIGRTFTHHGNNIDSKMKETALYNVLKAFANVDEDISYCQGMNIITGFILIMTEYNETNAWYILISLFCENFMLHEIPSLPSVSFPLRGLFSDDFPLLHFLLYIFDIEFEKGFHDLRAHLAELGIPNDVWISKWYQTMFTIILPVDKCMRVFDCIFAFGLVFMISFSLVFLKKIKTQLMNFEEESNVVDFFKHMYNFALSELDVEYCDLSDIDEMISKAIKMNSHIDYKKYYMNYISLYKEYHSSSKEYDLNVNTNILFETANNIISNDMFYDENIPSMISNTSVSLRNSRMIKKYVNEPIMENYDEDIDENIETPCNLRSSVATNVLRYEMSKPIKTLSEILHSFTMENNHSKLTRMKTTIGSIQLTPHKNSVIKKNNSNNVKILKKSNTLMINNI